MTENGKRKRCRRPCVSSKSVDVANNQTYYPRESGRQLDYVSRESTIGQSESKLTSYAQNRLVRRFKDDVGDNIRVLESTASDLLHVDCDFFTRCAYQRQKARASYEYSFRKFLPVKNVEIVEPVDKTSLFDAYKTELEFLEQHFAEVLPKILSDAAKKRVKDPVHYVVIYLMKYKLEKTMRM